jgi:hypothetical protein
MIVWGCVEPTQVSCEELEIEFERCPVHFIPESIVEWWKEYSYYMDYPGTAPKYQDQVPKFNEITNLYNGYLNTYQLLSRKNKPKS